MLKMVKSVKSVGMQALDRLSILLARVPDARIKHQVLEQHHRDRRLDLQAEVSVGDRHWTLAGEMRANGDPNTRPRLPPAIAPATLMNRTSWRSKSGFFSNARQSVCYGRAACVTQNMSIPSTRQPNMSIKEQVIDMPFRPDHPFNDLPTLPPTQDIETKAKANHP